VLVVATADFEAYHGLVSELRDRGVTFTTIEPDGTLPAEASVIVTTGSDDLAALEVDDLPVIVADPADPRSAVDRALAHHRDGAGRTVVGVDPGSKPGVAVLNDDQVVAAFQVPLAEVAAVVQEEVADGVDPVVRIGDGARTIGARIVDELEGVRVELVDETGTTPHLGTGARGMGDVLAAVNIARLEGEVTETVDIEPTAGEVRVVQNRSRERTGTETLPRTLARAVARGDLTLEEAIARHREEDTS
jgi:hypothetical protein